MHIVGFNFVRLQTSVTYVSCGLLWRRADLTTMSLWNEGRSAAAEGREISAMTTLLDNGSQTLAWALSAALYVLPLTQVLCLPQDLGLVADELGSPGSPGGLWALSPFGACPILQVHCPHPPKDCVRAFLMGNKACQVFSWLSTNPAGRPHPSMLLWGMQVV